MSVQPPRVALCYFWNFQKWDYLLQVSMELRRVGRPLEPHLDGGHIDPDPSPPKWCACKLSNTRRARANHANCQTPDRQGQTVRTLRPPATSVANTTTRTCHSPVHAVLSSSAMRMRCSSSASHSCGPRLSKLPSTTRIWILCICACSYSAVNLAHSQPFDRDPMTQI
jgi:hypothetical protein